MENRAFLKEAGAPVYEWPKRTARPAGATVAHAETRRICATQQAAPEPPPAGAREQAAPILTTARAQGRTLLLESEVKALLTAYGARIPRETLCTSSAEAQAAAQIHGGPYVLKI